METILPCQNNLTQNLEGNEENRYPVPDSNKTKVNDTKEPNNVHKNILKKDILQVITESFMEKILDMVIQNVQDPLKNFQDTKNEEYEDTKTNKKPHRSPK
jgi:hypothetical protein